MNITGKIGPKIRLPDEFLHRYLSVTETQVLRRSGVRILSITVRAEKRS